MSHIENVQVYKQDNEQGTSYMMFVEYNGLRFAKPWGLTKNAKVTPEDIANIFEANVQEELEQGWEELKYVGEPVEYPLPDWLSDWEKFEY